MPYYGQGDYYGQGGLGSILGGIGRAAIGFATGGPVGAATSIARSIVGSQRAQKTPKLPDVAGLQIPVTPSPGLRGMAQRLVPGGATGFEVMIPRRRRRRMNYANGRALTRANRRVDGFVKLARNSLKHTNYKIVSKSAGKSRRGGSPVVVETGPGSVRL